MSSVRSPALEALIARAERRVRGRRVVGGFLIAWCAGGLTACALEFVVTVRAGAGEPPFGHGTAFAVAGAVVAAGMAVAALGLFGRVDDERLARDLDRGLGLPDTAATVLAIVRGRVETPLAPWIVADAEPALAESLPGAAAAVVVDGVVERASGRLFLAGAFAWLVALLLLVLAWLHAFDFGFGLPRDPSRDTGVVPHVVPDSDRPVPAPGGGHAGTGEKPAPGPSPAAPDAPTPTPPDGTRPEPDADPAVQAKVRPGRERYTDTQPVVVSVSALPTRAIPNEMPLRIEVRVDDVVADTHLSLSLGPANPLGAGRLVDLRRVRGAAGKLVPGEHTVRARFVGDDGSVYESEPAQFRIEGPPGGGGGAGAPPPPPPAPQGSVPPPPPPAPGGTEPRPPETEPPPPPEVRVGFDPKVVAPLFGDGDEVRKKGLTVVLEPDGGTGGGPPRRVPIEDAIPDAVKRAEQSVDRGAVRPADRELVRRYFELLMRGVR